MATNNTYCPEHKHEGTIDTGLRNMAGMKNTSGTISLTE